MNITDPNNKATRRFIFQLPILSAALLLFAASCPAQQTGAETPPTATESSAEAKKRIAVDKAKTLETKLAANLSSDDALSALAELYQCYLMLGDEAQQLATLEKTYSVMIKKADIKLENIGFVLYRTVKLLGSSEKLKDIPKAKAIIEQAKKDLSKHPEAEMAKRLVAKLEGTINQPMIGGNLGIVFTALDGAKIDLATMKDKVVLVDFWATWCSPCVAELPRVKAAYEKFHDKGFEVIGISLDYAKDEDKLKKFIKDKNLPWPQSFEGKGWEHSLAAKYGISSIPATIVIGKDGKIAAIGVRGDELETKVAELLK